MKDEEVVGLICCLLMHRRTDALTHRRSAALAQSAKCFHQRGRCAIFAANLHEPAD